MEQKRKLHFGCLDRPVDGWFNTDITPHIWISRIPYLALFLYKVGKISKERFEQHKQGVFRKISWLDITKKFPFGDGYFQAAYSSHVLEHLYYDQARFALTEVHRVLLKGGILRIAVPDLDKCISDYDPSDPDSFCNALFETRQRRAKNQHHWMYNERSLRKLLHEIGFSEVYKCQCGQGKCPDVERIDSRPSSLFMDATR